MVKTLNQLDNEVMILEPEMKVPTKWQFIVDILERVRDQFKMNSIVKRFNRAIEIASEFNDFLDENYPGITKNWFEYYDVEMQFLTDMLKQRGSLFDVTGYLDEDIISDPSYCTACMTVGRNADPEYPQTFNCMNCKFAVKFGQCGESEIFQEFINILKGV